MRDLVLELTSIWPLDKSSRNLPFDFSVDAEPMWFEI